MTELKKTLRDSALARWTALLIVAFTMFGAYFFHYVLSPIKPLLESALGWTSSDFGFYTGAYGFFNVFLFMLIISGIILDKWGVRRTGLLAILLMALGTYINYFAIITNFPANATIFGINKQVLIASLGFAIFGIGTEAAGITVTKAVVRWFKNKEMALAMGLQISVARLGTALALAISIPLAKKFTVSTPILLALIFMLIGLLAFLLFIYMDVKLDKSEKNANIVTEEEFRIKDIVHIITNRAFWYIAILCVLFYSAVFPFLYYATDLMINKYHVSPNLAGLIPTLLPFGTILLTPLFGSIYDKLGKGATIMIIGAVMLIFVHGLLALPGITYWWFAAGLVIILGIAFSLVPAAMWPSVPKIIPQNRLGTAYAVIFWIQNIGLMLVPYLLGIALDKANPEVSTNKNFIKNTIEQVYTSELKSLSILTEKDINLALEKTSSKIIDSIVQYSSYEKVENKEVNIAFLKKQIVDTLSLQLQTANLQDIKDKKQLVNTIITISANKIYSMLTQAKLNVRYNYTVVELIFTLLGLLSLIFAVLLKREDRIKNYGLEKPNITK